MKTDSTKAGTFATVLLNLKAQIASIAKITAKATLAAFTASARKILKGIEWTVNAIQVGLAILANTN